MISSDFEAGGNPNYSDYGGKKPRYRLYYNRALNNGTWWCYEVLSLNRTRLHSICIVTSL